MHGIQIEFNEYDRQRNQKEENAHSEKCATYIEIETKLYWNHTIDHLLETGQPPQT